jgi:hypothetical protein
VLTAKEELRHCEHAHPPAGRQSVKRRPAIGHPPPPNASTAHYESVPVSRLTHSQARRAGLSCPALFTVVRRVGCLLGCMGTPRSQRTTGHPVRPGLRPRPPGRRPRQQPWRRPGRPRRAGPASATTTFLVRRGRVVGLDHSAAGFASNLAALAAPVAHVCQPA